MVKETTEKRKGKGNPNPHKLPPGPGRTKGIPNKATTQAREAIAMFVEGNVERLNGWLDAIAEDSPLAAFDRFMSVVEYHIPKLARTELTGDKKNPVAVEDVTDIKNKLLKAIPDDELAAILSTGNNNGGSDSGTT